MLQILKRSISHLFKLCCCQGDGVKFNFEFKIVHYKFIFLSPFQSLGGNELKSVNNVRYNLTSSMLYTIMYKQ